MNLIDEKNVSGREVGKDGCEIAHAFDCRPRGDLYLSIRFLCDQMSEGGFSKPWGSVKENMFGRMLALPCCSEKDIKVILDVFLAYIVVPLQRPERLIQKF